MRTRSLWACNRQPRHSSGCRACSARRRRRGRRPSEAPSPVSLVLRTPTLERPHRTSRARAGRLGAMGDRPVHRGLYRRLGDAGPRIPAHVCCRRRLRSAARNDPRVRRRGPRLVSRVRDCVAARVAPGFSGGWIAIHASLRCGSAVVGKGAWVMFLLRLSPVVPFVLLELCARAERRPLS